MNNITSSEVFWTRKTLHKSNYSCFCIYQFPYSEMLSGNQNLQNFKVSGFWRGILGPLSILCPIMEMLSSRCGFIWSCILMFFVHGQAVHIGNVVIAYMYCSSVRQWGRRKYFVQKDLFIAACLKENCSPRVGVWGHARVYI